LLEAIPPGTGSMRFEAVDGRTRLTRVVASSPLKLLNPRNAGTSAWAYAATYGGGLVGGDRVAIDIDVCAGASALVATQASTKVYRSKRQSTHTLRARAAGDSLLVLLPDPVACFAGARYRQEQQIDLEASSNLVLVDCVTAGRVGSGERWRLDEYTSRTVVRRGGRLIWHDALALTAQDGDIARRLERFNCLAFALVTGPALRETAARIIGGLAHAPVPHSAALLLSAAAIDGDGALLRIAGTSVEDVGAVLRQHLAVVASLLGDDPWRRKY